MAAESGFTIDGAVYEEVTVDDLDTDERFILYEYAKITQEDFAGPEGEADEERAARVAALIRHPGFWPAMWHCAYRRAHPDKDFAAIRAIVGKTKFVEAMETFGEEDDAVPPALTTEPDGSSEKSSVVKNESSGDGSTNGSDEQAVVPTPIGITRSGTYSTSDPESSVA